MGTDGSALIEYWHGVNLPPNMLIPMAAVTAIVKSSKELVGFGYSGSSLTFHFSDGSWIRTSLINKPYVNYHSVFNDFQNTVFCPLHSAFYDGVKSLESFAPDGNIIVTSSGLSTSDLNIHFGIDEGVLPDDIAFNAKYLLKIQDFITSAHFDVSNNQLMFYGDSLRGILKGVEI